MIASKDVEQKKDLHIGGLGATSNVNSLIWADDFIEETGSLGAQLQAGATRAEEFVRARPWQAIGLVAIASFTAALLLTRRRAGGT